jgi:hypothetical protein
MLLIQSIRRFSLAGDRELILSVSRNPILFSDDLGCHSHMATAEWVGEHANHHIDS